MKNEDGLSEENLVIEAQISDGRDVLAKTLLLRRIKTQHQALMWLTYSPTAIYLLGSVIYVLVVSGELYSGLVGVTTAFVVLILFADILRNAGVLRLKSEMRQTQNILLRSVSKSDLDEGRVWTDRANEANIVGRADVGRGVIGKMRYTEAILWSVLIVVLGTIL